MSAPAARRTRKPAAAHPVGRPGPIRDLLYTRNNVSLDIARLCAFVSVLAFWAAVGWTLYSRGEFDPVAAGTGCAAIFAASAAWIHFRQKHEGAQQPEGAS